MRRMKNETQKITEAHFAVIPRWSPMGWILR